MGPPARRVRRRGLLREALLTLGAVAGVVCLLAAVASIGFGIRPLMFRSGSMSPTIETGALALARPAAADDVRAGDVVSVTNASGTRITHRVLSLTHASPSATLILKGDANDIPDAEPYVLTRVDRVFFHVNQLGYIVSAISGPVGVFAGGVLVGALLMFAFGPRSQPDRRADEAPPARQRRALRSPLSLTAVLLVLGLSLSGGIRPSTDTEAAWADVSSSSSGNFATLARVATPTISCGALGVGSVRLNWTAVTGATNYLLTLTPSGQATQQIIIASGTTSYTITGSSGSGVASVQAFYQYPSTSWYSVDSSQAQYHLILFLVGTCSVA